MSIIEKALSKRRETGFGKDRAKDDQNASGGAGAVDSSEGVSRVEQAMERQRAQASSSTQRAEVEEPGPLPTAPESAQATEPLAAPATRRSATISRQRLDALGLLNPAGGHTQVAEEFRLVKRPLLKNAFANGGEAVERGNMIMVTSALPKEGKSFCVINLAMSIAMEFDRTVLLVDADVARPSILEYLGVDSEGPGLLDLLSKEGTDFPEALVRTDIDNLTLLPAGTTHPRANEVLASKDMENLVAEMSTRYSDRIILFDTPPLLATSEASVLASHMGQVVLVVEAENTPKDATVRAMEQLQSCDTVLPLLNKSKPLPGMRYSYGYYGSYYEHGN